MDPEAIEARLREFFAANAEREGIAAAYLFGSVARGTAGAGSDVVLGCSTPKTCSYPWKI